jgi:putative tryptophan/tyrosine transport system substrate-binding protein
MIRRLIAGMIWVGLGLLGAPSHAQTYTIGVFEYGTRSGFEPLLAAFKEGLREGGFVEGQNLRIEQRYADYDYRKVDRIAEELVRAKAQVIFAPTTWAVHGAMAATKTIPIVFAAVNDPVGVKFVKSLARPGGNVTGISVASNELTAKRLELMRELFPTAARIGVVYDQDAAKACQLELKDIGLAGRQLGIDVREYSYQSKSDLRGAFDRGQRANVAGVLIPTTMETRRVGSELVTLSADNRMPTIHADRGAVEAGGLMSYGPNNNWAYRRAGNYVARILKGTKPEDLPVERPAEYELVINLKTARALGITFPASILMRATDVIQ